MDASLIKKAIITEKSTDLNKIGQYVFMVERSATKNEVKKAVKEIYKVDAVAVNIVNRPEKRKHFRGLTGKQKGYKKAIVTLKEGQKINLT